MFVFFLCTETDTDTDTDTDTHTDTDTDTDTDTQTHACAFVYCAFGDVVQVVPTGIVSVEFPHDNERYTFHKQTVVVHNVLFGRMWVDHEGVVTVTNHRTGETCDMIWSPYSSVGRKYFNLHGLCCKKRACTRMWMCLCVSFVCWGVCLCSNHSAPQTHPPTQTDR